MIPLDHGERADLAKYHPDPLVLNPAQFSQVEQPSTFGTWIGIALVVTCAVFVPVGILGLVKAVLSFIQ
jgi:hypothetical protein